MNSFTPVTSINGHPPPHPSTGDEIIRLVDVRRRFGTTPALDGVSLTARRGEIVGIIGRSGAGKSTLIRCLNGLERADSGEIHIEGRDIAGLSEKELQPLRRRIGMVFQHFNLLSAKTVEENIALPLKIEGVAKAERLQRRATCLNSSALPTRQRPIRLPFPAARNSVSALPALSLHARRFFCRMKRPRRSIRKRRDRSLHCSRISIASSGSPFC